MKKRVALVLGSGGARGYAHIGVIEEIERRGYDIACIAGCSMGAVVGGIYAAGKLNEYRDWIESLDYLDVLRLVDVSFRLGAIRGEKVFGQIRKIVGEINIEDLRIPYTAVAADLTNQQEIWFQEGCLHQAMRASAAIPSLFTPVMQGNRMLVDGGILNPPADRAGGVEPLRPDHRGQPQLHQPAPLPIAGDPAPRRVQDPLRQPDQLSRLEVAVPA
ncbi:putative acylesterase/phospholipase RssA [Pseudomonas sp. AP3_22 TE3818]